MKRVFLFLIPFVLLVGCKMNADGVSISIPKSKQPEVAPAPSFVDKEKKVIENVDPTEIIEDEILNSSQKNGDTVYSSDKYNGTSILTITPRYDGLLIKKNHAEEWTHNTIHVINQTTGLENAKIDNIGNDVNEVLYPFVKKGNYYRVYIEKQETIEENGVTKDWQNWGTSKDVYVTAVGGIGNLTVKFNEYLYNNDEKAITFKDLRIWHPDEVSKNSLNWQGVLFRGTVWGSAPANYAFRYEQEKSKLLINADDSEYLKNLEKLGAVVELKYNGYDSVAKKYINYIIPVVSSVIYDKSVDESQNMNLTGGETIPSVYITSAKGYQHDKTFHFGDGWGDASLRIVDKDGITTLLEDSISIKDRGNSTKWPGDGGKTPFSIKLSTKQEVLGMKKHKRWVLMANYFDRSLIRTEFAGYLGRNVFNSYWNAKFKPVNVFINGNYYGTYDLGECNKIAKQRVDIQSIEDYVNNDPDYDDINGDGKVDINDAGFMVEIDTAINWGSTINSLNYKTEVATDNNGAERIYFYSSEKCIPMTLKDPDFGDSSEYSEEVCKEVGEYAKSKIDAFEKMLYSSSFQKKFTKYIDSVSFIDWYLTNEFAKNSDANFQKSVPVVL